MTGDLSPTTVLPPRCPSCDSTVVFGLSGGNMLCGNCRYEWDVADPSPPPAPPAPADAGDGTAGGEIAVAHITHVGVTVQNVDTLETEQQARVAMTQQPHTAAEAERIASADTQHDFDRDHPVGLFRVVAAQTGWSSLPFAVDPAAPSDSTADARPVVLPDTAGTVDPLAELVSHEVELFDGTHGIVRGFPDDDTVTIETRRGRKVDVPIDDIAVDVTLRDAETGAVVEMSDDSARALAGTYALGAALAIEAGVAMVDGAGPDATVGVAPSGWLPFDTDEAALVEQMAACAVAALVRAFDLPRESVAVITTTLRLQATGDPNETEQQ